MVRDIETLDAANVTAIPTPMGIDDAVIDGQTWLFVASWTGGVHRLDPDDPKGSMTHIFTPAAGGPIYDIAYGNGR